MKSIALAFTILLVGANAVPKPVQLGSVPVPELAGISKSNERFVDIIIIELINVITDQIQEMGLDPLNVPVMTAQYKLPVTDLLNIDAGIWNLQAYGLSNIVINSISFNVLTTRLQMDVSLPRLAASVQNFVFNAEILGLDFNSAVSGSFAIVEQRLVLDMRINIGVISGISIRNLEIDVSLGGIESDLNVSFLGYDASDLVNVFFGETLPTAIADNRADINELIEYLAWLAIDQLL